MKSKRYTIIGIVAIVSLIFFVVVTFCGKGHQWSNNVVQGFKSLGLKGNVKVIGTYKEIEAFHGTVVEVNYTERFSDGYFLDKNLRADIRESNGEHISDFYPPLSTKIEALLNDKEKDLFDTVKFNEFSFLLDVYKMRPGFQREEDKIKKDVANKINKLFDRQVTFDYSYKFEPVSREKIYATILSQAVRNRDNGDFEALGTTLSQTLSVIVALFGIRRHKTGLRLSRQNFRPRKGMLGRILKIGLPVAVQDGCIQVAFIIITIIANHRGLIDSAAVGIVEKIISAMFIVPSSMLATVSALSSQNLGAGKPERAAQTLKYAAMIATGYGIAVVLVIELVAEPLLGCFTTDAAVVLMGCQYIRGYIVDTIFAGIHFSFTGYFAACGKSYIGFLHNIIAIVLVRVPGSYLASRLFAGTLLPMGLAAPAGSLLSVMICVAAYRWMKRRGTLYTAA